ncbi:MAG: outer membrane lipoprotein carrier protein LolA [Proteobacteria bacterium]|nr:outer membrane lipoprotein carrier protein LolA [Pseudomonadota bacterium]MBU1710673.1 outer membrane lipoprotein carrier protein LolA [Pseudomonadota bacterium]
MIYLFLNESRLVHVARTVPGLTVTIVFLLLILLQVPALGSESQDLDRFLEKVERKSSEIQSFTCNFRQERHLSIFTRPVIFEGELFLVRPSQLRWEFLRPVPSVMIFNGSKGMRCSGKSEPQQFDLATNPVMKMVSSQLWNWMDGSYGKMQDAYRIELAAAGTGIRLQPIDERLARAIAEIRIDFEPVTLQPEKVEIFEQGGDRTVISFSSYLPNISLDESLFTRCLRQ